MPIFQTKKFQDQQYKKVFHFHMFIFTADNPMLQISRWKAILIIFGGAPSIFLPIAQPRTHPNLTLTHES